MLYIVLFLLVVRTVLSFFGALITNKFSIIEKNATLEWRTQFAREVMRLELIWFFGTTSINMTDATSADFQFLRVVDADDDSMQPPAELYDAALLPLPDDPPPDAKLASEQWPKARAAVCPKCSPLQLPSSALCCAAQSEVQLSAVGSRQLSAAQSSPALPRTLAPIASSSRKQPSAVSLQHLTYISRAHSDTEALACGYGAAPRVVSGSPMTPMQ